MYSAAANGTRPAPVRPAPAEGTTSTGLARRVPGAQRPDAAFAPRPADPAPSSAPATEPVRTTPEDVYSFLSSFQSGVARGRADAANTTESQEDER